MIDRANYKEKIKKGFSVNPIVVLLGARQVGKTSLMKIYSREFPGFWINGENPDTMQLFSGFSIIEKYLKVNINNKLSGLLFIDEFQYIDNISVMLKLLTDKYPDLKILCSGSSSLDIHQQVKESLAGRVRIIPVYSLSFNEYVKFNDQTLYENLQSYGIEDDIAVFLPEIPVFLKEYLLYGGLPKIVLTKDPYEKEELLNDIYQTYLLRDVRQYVQNKDFVGFNKLIKILSSQTGNLLNPNEISKTVQLPYKTCVNYIHLLQQMFIIHLVSPFSTNKRNEITKMKKIYFGDLGLRNIIYNSFNDIDIRTDKGSLLENFVYLELLKTFRSGQIFYYRTKDKTEIDFVVTDRKQNIVPVEVKYKKFDTPVNIRAITEFAKTNRVKRSYIVNLNLIDTSNSQRFIQPYRVGEITGEGK
jgi:predicted AAA+ superfamily ATPase